eukprot:4748759-Pyramimonas_sp.AAC.1
MGSRLGSAGSGDKGILLRESYARVTRRQKPTSRREPSTVEGVASRPRPRPKQRRTQVPAGTGAGSGPRAEIPDGP